MPVSLGLQDRVILVTGGSRGIGRAIAATLVQAGARTAICGRDPEHCRRTAAELGNGVLPLTSDIGEDSAVARMIETTVSCFGRLDGVVNNAGQFGGGPAIELSDEALHSAVNTKPAGSLRVVRHALPYLRDSDQARVVNVSGASAERVTIGAAATAVANASVLALTAYLARELIGDGILVNAVIPGFVRSGVWESRIGALASAEGLSTNEAAAAILERQSIGHARWGHPEEVATVVLFLLSNLSSFVSGAAMRVDGGQAATVSY